MKRFLAALAVFAVAASAQGQGFDFRTTGTTTTQVVNLRCSTITPAVSQSNWAKFWVPCAAPLTPPTPAYTAGNIYISQNTGAWTLLSSFVGSGVVNSVFGRTGTVIAVAGDYTGTLVTNTPAGGVAAVTVQAAIAELDTEKAPKASPTFTGVPAVPTAAPGTNTTQAASTAFTTAAVAAATGAVTSVFTRTGAVTALQADYDSFFTTTAEASAAAPVQSVFGRTGAVAALQADYDAFFVTPAEGDARYALQTGGNFFTSIAATANISGGGLGITVTNTATVNAFASMEVSTYQVATPSSYFMASSGNGAQSWIWGQFGSTDFRIYDGTFGREVLKANVSDGKVTTNLSATATAVTAAAADSDTSIATTAFVQQEAPVKSVAGRTGAVTIASTDLTDTVNPFKGGTGIDSSASTGVPRLLSGVWTFDAGLSHLASSTSAQLKTLLSDDTGTGVSVFNDTPTILTPTIASFVNATHTHVSAATGGALDTGSLTSGTLAVARGGTGTTTSTGTGSTVLSASPTFTGVPILAAPTATTIQTSGNVGIGAAPSGTVGFMVDATQNTDAATEIRTNNSNAAGTTAAGSVFRATASTASTQFAAWGAGRTTTRFGVTIGSWNEFISTAGNGLIVGTFNSAPLRIGSNAVAAIVVDASQNVSLPVQAITAGTMTGTYEATTSDVTTCRSWTNAQVAALAGTAGDIAWGTLPAKTKVLDAGIVITGAAVGPTTVTVALGRTSAAYIDYIVASDAKAAANTFYGDVSGERGTNLTGYDLPSYTATTVINAHFISTGANLSTVTGSTGQVCITTRKLP